jgi:putative membrane protein
MRMVLRLAVAVCAVGLAVAPAPADDKKPISETDFVARAASCSIHHIELGKLAATNAVDPELKKFAERLVADHTKALDDLKTAAKSANVPVPDKMDADDQKEVDRCRSLKGADFDKAYIAHVVADHQKGESFLTRARNDLKNPNLKGFADKSLPIVQDHLKQARAINDRINKK